MKENKERKNNTSGIVGVRFHKNRWYSRTRVNGKEMHLGCFDTKEEAKAVYINFKISLLLDKLSNY